MEYRVAILIWDTEVIVELHLKTNVSKLFDSLKRVVRLFSSCLQHTRGFLLIAFVITKICFTSVVTIFKVLVKCAINLCSTWTNRLFPLATAPVVIGIRIRKPSLCSGVHLAMGYRLVQRNNSYKCCCVSSLPSRNWSTLALSTWGCETVQRGDLSGYIKIFRPQISLYRILRLISLERSSSCNLHRLYICSTMSRPSTAVALRVSSYHLCSSLLRGDSDSELFLSFPRLSWYH